MGNHDTTYPGGSDHPTPWLGGCPSPQVMLLPTESLWAVTRHREIMNSEELQESLKATTAAFVPAMAVKTSETQACLDQICLFAAKTTWNLPKDSGPRKVFVWRVSEGFVEWGCFREEDGEYKHYDTIGDGDPEDGYYADVIDSDAVERPEDEFDDMTQFAVEHIRAWDYEEHGCGAIFVLRDWHHYIDGDSELIDRQLAVFEDIYNTAQLKSVIMVSPTIWDIPPELETTVYVADLDRPDKQWRTNRVEYFIQNAKNDPEKISRLRRVVNMKPNDIEDVSDACAGLTRTEIDNLLCMSMAVKDTMDTTYILREKERNIRRQGFNLIRPNESFKMIGGLTPLKEWIHRQKMRFTDAAVEYGFPRFPRGMLLAGVPGCGKSLIAKALAKEWNMNILQVQATDLKGSLVGESEGKVSKLLEVANAAAPIVVFIDEAEKLLGSQDSVRDGGAHDAVMAQFLSFMQDNNTGVYFVFTANQMKKFSPELVDRFEGRWFVDLPSDDERRTILDIHLRKREQDPEGLEMDELTRLTKDFSGRNIEDSIEEAMSIGFVDGRPTVMEDYRTAFNAVVPTSKTKKNEIQEMREYVANGTMRAANTPVDKKQDRSRARGFGKTNISEKDVEVA